VHLHVVPEVGPGGEALVALLAGEGLLLGVDPPVADELGGDAEGLAAVGALVALGLCVDAPVVLQGHEVGELLLARVAEVGAHLVAVLVVEQGAGMAVGTPTLVAHVRLYDPALTSAATSLVHAMGGNALRLHQGVV